MITFQCPKCGAKVKVLSDKYPPTCQNEERHHSKKVYEMIRREPHQV